MPLLFNGSKGRKRKSTTVKATLRKIKRSKVHSSVSNEETKSHFVAEIKENMINSDINKTSVTADFPVAPSNLIIDFEDIRRCIKSNFKLSIKH